MNVAPIVTRHCRPVKVLYKNSFSYFVMADVYIKKYDPLIDCRPLIIAETDTIMKIKYTQIGSLLKWRIDNINKKRKNCVTAK